MRAVIQRVTRASVAVNGGEPRPIGPGLVILLGVRDTDDIAIVPKLAEKCAHLRIFEDEDGKLNRSAVELGYSALVVSNFTLYGDTSRGKRPSFSHAAKGDRGSSQRRILAHIADRALLGIGIGSHDRACSIASRFTRHGFVKLWYGCFEWRCVEQLTDHAG